MLWKIYVGIFTAVNILSVVSFQYSLSNFFGLISLILSIGLNIGVFSYAYNRPVLSKQVLTLLFKANVGLIGIFLLFELITFFQEIVGTYGLSLPTSGVISIIASIPSLPALYATYQLVHPKASKRKHKKKLSLRSHLRSHLKGGKLKQKA